jgi:hypothetical protein
VSLKKADQNGLWTILGSSLGYTARVRATGL